jgi:hypothetical protein
MRFLALLILSLSATSIQAADLTPLYPEKAWSVLGIELKALHESPLGKATFQQDGPTVAASKVGLAFGNTDMEVIKNFAPLFDKAERITFVKPETTEDFRLFVEGVIDDDLLAKTLAAESKRHNRKYATAKVGDRTIHEIDGNVVAYRIIRLDAKTLALVTSDDELTDLLERHAGQKKVSAPKVIIDGVKAIDGTKTPLWLVFGENKYGNDVLYSRMVATVAVGADIELQIRMETPNEAAAKQSQELLSLYAFGLTQARMQPLQHALGSSRKVNVNGTTVTATATVPGKQFTEVYSKQK